MGFKGKKLFNENRNDRRGSDSAKASSSSEPREETPRATETAEPPTPVRASNGPTADDLQRVRELLFGNKLREHEDEIGRLESRLLERISSATESMGRNLDTLEELVLGQMNNAIERVNGEARERKDGEEALVKRFDEFANQIESKIADISERSKRAEHDLRDQLLSQCKLLSDTIAQRHEDVVNLFNEGLMELKTHKLDRSAFAAALVDVAARLDAGATKDAAKG